MGHRNAGTSLSKTPSIIASLRRLLTEERTRLKRQHHQRFNILARAKFYQAYEVAVTGPSIR